MGTPTNTIVWAALCVSQVIYVVVAFLTPPQPASQDVLTTMFPPLLLIAVLLASGTIWWRRRALVQPIQSGELDLETPQGQGKAFTALILNLVLSESVAIYGLVLTFLSNDIRYVIGFVAAGLVLMFIHRPFAAALQPPQNRLGSGSRPPPIA